MVGRTIGIISFKISIHSYNGLGQPQLDGRERSLANRGACSRGAIPLPCPAVLHLRANTHRRASILRRAIAHRTTPPPSLIQRVPGTDPGLAVVCMELLSKEPTERPTARVALEMSGASRKVWLDPDGLNVAAGERTVVAAELAVAGLVPPLVAIAARPAAALAGGPLAAESRPARPARPAGALRLVARPPCVTRPARELAARSLSFQV